LSALKDDSWLYVISSKKKLIDFNFKEIWQYRDLLFLFVKRNVITVYKQTILGPLWYLIQPLFTSVIFTVIFNDLAEIPTGVAPAFLFNLAGITSWNYFKECFVGTSNTFVSNQAIFGKVYFPRVIVPMSTVVSNLIKYGIQILVFIGFYLYYVFIKGKAIQPDSALLLFPVLVIVMGLLGLGFGMIISSMTTKYRDMTFLVNFGVQLLMYASAVMYPVSFFKKKLPSLAWLVEYNPMTTVIEAFRFMAFGVGDYSVEKLFYAVVFSVIIFLIGLVVFNKTEKSFIDTI
jgi:lipopolysaccharide transport system permease protein